MLYNVILKNLQISSRLKCIYSHFADELCRMSNQMYKDQEFGCQLREVQPRVQSVFISLKFLTYKAFWCLIFLCGTLIFYGKEIFAQVLHASKMSFLLMQNFLNVIYDMHTMVVQLDFDASIQIVHEGKVKGLIQALYYWKLYSGLFCFTVSI